MIRNICGMMTIRNNIALSGLKNFKRTHTQGYASLHPGLWVLRAFGTIGVVFLARSKVLVAKRRCTFSPRWSEAEPWVESYNILFQALKGRSNLAVSDKYQFQWWACSLVDAQPY